MNGTTESNQSAGGDAGAFLGEGDVAGPLLLSLDQGRFAQARALRGIRGAEQAEPRPPSESVAAASATNSVVCRGWTCRALEPHRGLGVVKRSRSSRSAKPDVPTLGPFSRSIRLVVLANQLRELEAMDAGDRQFLLSTVQSDCSSPRVIICISEASGGHDLAVEMARLVLGRYGAAHCVGWRTETAPSPS